jgi:hypothetical protein
MSEKRQELPLPVFVPVAVAPLSRKDPQLVDFTPEGFGSADASHTR